MNRIPREIFDLAKGIAFGWIVLFTTKPTSLAWLYWKCWYWPFYARRWGE